MPMSSVGENHIYLSYYTYHIIFVSSAEVIFRIIVYLLFGEYQQFSTCKRFRTSIAIVYRISVLRCSNTSIVYEHGNDIRFKVLADIARLIYNSCKTFPPSKPRAPLNSVSRVRRRRRRAIMMEAERRYVLIRVWYATRLWYIRRTRNVRIARNFRGGADLRPARPCAIRALYIYISASAFCPWGCIKNVNVLHFLVTVIYAESWTTAFPGHPPMWSASRHIVRRVPLFPSPPPIKWWDFQSENFFVNSF